MKKLAALFVIAALLLPPILIAPPSSAARAETPAGEAYHLLWGIPFGASPETFVEMAREKSSFVYVLDDGSNGFKYSNAVYFFSGRTFSKEKAIYYVDMEKQNASFLGFSLKGAYAVFEPSEAGEQALQMIRFAFNFPQSVPEKKGMLELLFSAVSGAYGNPTGGCVYVTGGDEMLCYNAPLAGAGLDLNTIELILSTSRAPRFEVCWRNIRLSGSESGVEYLDFYGYSVDYPVPDIGSYADAVNKRQEWQNPNAGF